MITLDGGPPEFAERAGFGIKALKRVYDAEFKKFQPLDVAGPLTVAALKDDKVQCANLFSTQSAIESAASSRSRTRRASSRPRPCSC